ncbi:hypothetical protein F7U66_00580 [Vibrio parahaemolyticus]|nr:hypothetical protein [Vibrio parahaemolyticus]
MEKSIETQDKSINQLSDLKVGMLVSISNGEKEPPKHHTKKHKLWSSRNRKGYVFSVEPEFGSFGLVERFDDISATGMRVRVITNYKFNSYSVVSLG